MVSVISVEIPEEGVGAASSLAVAGQSPNPAGAANPHGPLKTIVWTDLGDDSFFILEGYSASGGGGPIAAPLAFCHGNSGSMTLAIYTPNVRVRRMNGNVAGTLRIANATDYVNTTPANLAMNVPAEGSGNALDTSNLPPIRTISWADGDDSDVFMVEGSNDGGATWASVAQIKGQDGSFNMTAYFQSMRLRRLAGTGFVIATVYACGTYPVAAPASADGIVQRTVDVTAEDLATLGNVTEGAVAMGADLPAGAIIIGLTAQVIAPFAVAGGVTDNAGWPTVKSLEGLQITIINLVNEVGSIAAGQAGFGFVPGGWQSARAHFADFVRGGGDPIPFQDLTEGQIRFFLFYTVPVEE